MGTHMYAKHFARSTLLGCCHQRTVTVAYFIVYEWKKTKIKFESPTLIEIHVAIVYAITENKHHIHVTGSR